VPALAPEGPVHAVRGRIPQYALLSHLLLQWPLLKALAAGSLHRMAAEDLFARALVDLNRALDMNLERIALIKRRIEEIQHQRAAGRPYSEIVESTKTPLTVQLLTEARQSLDTFGARVRRTEALALHTEGMTMEAIAERFGVTRQRVSALLREARKGSAL
jgi:hypothetical protein